MKAGILTEDWSPVYVLDTEGKSCEVSVNTMKRYHANLEEFNQIQEELRQAYVNDNP